MYTREEILNNYKKIDFPKSLFDESALSNKEILFYPNSRLPSSTKEKDTSQLSQSYIVPWRLLHQKHNYINNNNQNKKEFVRSGFTPAIPKEPLIELKTENFKNIYDKFSIPLEIKLIYLKYLNNISGPFNFEELQNMYKNKKYDSNYEFRTIDIFFFDEEDTFNFFPIKNINEENWEEEFSDSPLLEYTNLFSKIKELLDASKKRKLEINELNSEIDDLKLQNDEKDIKIGELSKEIESLKKELKIKNELLEKKEKQKYKEEDEKEVENKNEDKKETKKEKIIEIEKNVIIDKKYDDDDEEEKEIIEEQRIEIIQPKVLDMGEKWEIAGKKKKKVEKVQDDSKEIVGLSSKKSGGIKNNADSLIKMPGTTKTKKPKNSGEELVEMLRPKKKEEPKKEGELSTTEFKEVKGKGKKKNKKQFENSNIKLGFNY